MTEDQKQQAKIAQSVGFDAYGTSSKTMDPVANAIHGLIQHIQASEKRMDLMCETIRKLGGQVPEAEKMPELNACELNEEGQQSKVD